MFPDVLLQSVGKHDLNLFLPEIRRYFMIRILTDSASDILPAEAEQLGVTVIPYQSFFLMGGGTEWSVSFTALPFGHLRFLMRWPGSLETSSS